LAKGIGRSWKLPQSLADLRDSKDYCRFDAAVADFAGCQWITTRQMLNPDNGL